MKRKLRINDKLSVDINKVLHICHQTRNQLEKCWVEVMLKNGKTIVSNRSWYELLDDFQKLKTESANERSQALPKISRKDNQSGS
jgi:hypothetical protein